MKWLAAALVLVTASGCFPDFTNPHLEPRGLTEEDLNAPPGRNEIKSAIVNDARNRRALRFLLDEGKKTAPDALKLDKYGVQAVRAKDEFPMWRVTIWEDPVERMFAVTEVGYWDNERSEYYYHYEGGNPHRDVWLGPFNIQFSKRPQDDDGHGH